MSDEKPIDMRTMKRKKYSKTLTFNLSNNQHGLMKDAIKNGPFENMSEVLRYCISKAFGVNDVDGHYE